MSYPLRDIVISGMGLAAPLGHSPDAVFDGLLEQRSGITEIQAFDPSVFSCSVGGHVTDFSARQWVKNRKNLKLMTDAVKLGMAGVKRAYDDAQVTDGSLDPNRFGIFVGAGTAVGRTEDLLPAISAASEDGGFNAAQFGAVVMHRINPLWLLKGLSNNVLGFSTADLDARGINQNYCNSGVGGLQAVGEAAWTIAEGRADFVIAGGADCAINPLHMTGLGRLGALTSRSTPDATRPFDASHDGFAPAQGAAFFVLEHERSAHSSQRVPRARIAAYANGCAGHAMGRGDASVVTATLRDVLKRAGWAPTDVDLFYAHGNGTAKYDGIEAEALRTVFGEDQPPVTSNKGNLGHTIAASGPLSLACALVAMERSLIPPVLFHEKLAADCHGIDLVHSEPRSTPVRRCLVQAAGIGGQTTVLALEALS